MYTDTGKARDREQTGECKEAYKEFGVLKLAQEGALCFPVSKESSLFVKVNKKVNHSVDVRRKGLVEGTPVERILLNTGCSKMFQ